MDISKSELAAVLEAAGVVKHSGQFCHVATYARKISALSGKTKASDSEKPLAKRAIIWTVADIAAEADRNDPSHHPHVSKSLAPKLVSGKSVSELEAICDVLLIDAKQSNGKALRSDTHVLLAAVYSIDVAGSEYELHKERCDKFIADSIAWHAKMYGEVVSAITHEDEGFFHAHVYSISEDARGMIPGWRAKREAIKFALGAGKLKNDANKDGNSAYKKAMIEVQNSYFFEVGSVNGLARYGNRRMRYQPGSGESITKKRQREEFVIREKAAREQDEINRKKLSESVLEQERITAESARGLAEIKAEKRRIREVAENLNAVQKFSDEREHFVDTKVQNLLKTPEFIKDQIAKENKKSLMIANERIESLEHALVEKNSYIDKLLKTVSDLKNTIKKLLEKLV